MQKHQTVPWKHAMCTEAAVEVTSRSMEHSGKQQIIATVLWKHRHSGSYPAAADHIATVLWKHRLVTAIQQQQIIIATVLWKCRLVAAIQQLYKLLYKSCIEAKQNNAQV